MNTYNNQHFNFQENFTTVDNYYEKCSDSEFGLLIFI